MPPNEDAQLSPHFRRSEFQCKCGGKYRGCNRNYTPPAQLLDLLEKTRAKYYPTGLIIISAYRCRGYQKEVNPTVTDSCHTLGIAIDLDARMTEHQARALGWTGTGIDRSTGHVSHLDMGPVRRWYYDR